MQPYSLSHLADDVLIRDLAALAARDRATTAALLAHIAEVDQRKLYLPQSCSSMEDWCVGELRMSEDVAHKRIRAARTARKFPGIFAAVADGRLNLTAVLMLAPHLTPENADDLLAAGANRTNLQIERLLAERFPRLDVAGLGLAGDAGSMVALPLGACAEPLAVQPDGLAEGETAAGPGSDRDEQVAVRPPVPSVQSVSPAPMGPLCNRARLTPIGPGAYELKAILGQATREKLVRAQELLSHAVAPGDLVAVLDRAVAVLVAQLEKRRCAATDRPRAGAELRSANPRHVPAEVVRAVWVRDGGQCAFVGENGRRCEKRHGLELDHLDPVGRGGHASADRMRLLCRPHNQYVAEREYGAEFMRGRREAARRRATEARMRKEAARARGAEARRTREAGAAGARAEEAARTREAAAAEAAQARATAAAAAKARVAEAVEIARQQEELVPWLRALGFTLAEARAAATRCVAIVGAPLEERIKYALRFLAPPSARRSAPRAGNAA